MLQRVNGVAASTSRLPCICHVSQRLLERMIGRRQRHYKAKEVESEGFWKSTRDEFQPSGDKPDFRSNATKTQAEHFNIGISRPGRSSDRMRNDEDSDMPIWRKHRAAMRETFPDGWNPPRKISRMQMNTIRSLYASDSIKNDTPNLAAQFRVSPEAIRRILKSRWRSDDEKEEEAQVKVLEEAAEWGEVRPYRPVNEQRRIKIWEDVDRHSRRESGFTAESRYDAEEREDGASAQIAERHVRARPLRAEYATIARRGKSKWAVP